MENKIYVAPEAIVVKFEEADLLSGSTGGQDGKLNFGPAGDTGKADW